MRTSADAFGTRDFLNGRYLDRMSGAVLGIYGNSKAEAIYPVYFVDEAKRPLSGANEYEYPSLRDLLALQYGRGPD